MKRNICLFSSNWRLQKLQTDVILTICGESPQKQKMSAILRQKGTEILLPNYKHNKLCNATVAAKP